MVRTRVSHTQKFLKRRKTSTHLLTAVLNKKIRCYGTIFFGFSAICHIANWNNRFSISEQRLLIGISAPSFSTRSYIREGNRANMLPHSNIVRLQQTKFTEWIQTVIQFGSSAHSIVRSGMQIFLLFLKFCFRFVGGEGRFSCYGILQFHQDPQFLHSRLFLAVLSQALSKQRRLHRYSEGWVPNVVMATLKQWKFVYNNSVNPTAETH